MNLSANRPPQTPQIRLYQNWLASERGLTFDSYDALWQWSVTDLPAFWQSVWDYFAVQSPAPHSAVIVNRGMPEVDWFVGAQVNYAQQVLRHAQPAHAAGMLAIIAENELGEVQEISWPELHARVAMLAIRLKKLGVQRGDRVAAYLPNIPDTIICALATFSIGAVWSVCAPDMGVAAVIDRFAQIEPVILIAAQAVHYGGKTIDRRAVVAELQSSLPSLRHTLALDDLHALWHAPQNADAWREIAAFEPEPVPFDHPLWIVYSSGTTGLPKPIVHGHGGIVLAVLTNKCLGNDVGCSYSENNWGERFHWYSSTGWVMWNAQMGGLCTGTTICIYDGNPSGNKSDSKTNPDWGTLWRFAARHKVTFFGAGAAFYTNCMKAGLDIAACDTANGDLSLIRALGSTGSPLPEDVERWGLTQLPHIWWCNISGGTDFCGAFIGGNRELPSVPGQMQCRLLGCAVEAWDEHSVAQIDTVGELVCTQPMPSMPLYFWNDPNKARYLSSYFDMYAGVWRLGDWLKVAADGSCIIYGRSDATINRMGLRMGTSEIYKAVEALPEVLDSMVVDLEYLGCDSDMPLFVVLRAGVALDAGMKSRINQAIAKGLSPRFVPNEIYVVDEIPRTLSGKKQELPIKKLLLGQPLDKVVNPEAMANPLCLAWYAAFARARNKI